MINVVSQTTAERRKEIKENFKLIKPYLDDGYSYSKACIKAGLGSNRNCTASRWFKDLREYGETQGYPYRDYKYPRKIKR